MTFIKWFIPVLIVSVLGGAVGKIYLAPIVEDMIVAHSDGIHLPAETRNDTN